METILLIFSLVLTISFLTYTKLKYGWLSSISRSAKFLTKDGTSILFFIFIAQLCLVMGWVGQSYFSALAMMILLGIGIFTGYNPKVSIDKIENTLHVILTNLAILLIMADIITKGISSKDLTLMITSISLVLIFAVSSFILWKKRVKNHTYWIEVICLVIVYLFYFIYKI